MIICIFFTFDLLREYEIKDCEKIKKACLVTRNDTELMNLCTILKNFICFTSF